MVAAEGAVLLLLGFCSMVVAPQPPRTRGGRGCVLNMKYSMVSAELEVRVAFRSASDAASEPDPMQTRRFRSDREYTLLVRSRNPLLGIARYFIGLLAHNPTVAAGGGNPDVGRLLPSSEKSELPARGCRAFYCDVGCQVRSEVRFNWTAPSTEGAACVEIRALVGLELDEKTLVKSSLFLCGFVPNPLNSRRFPAAPCCACGSANYLLRFQGSWNPTRSRDELAGSWGQQLSWSELLGTTHDDSYALWEFGGYSSAGVKDFCEQGNSSVLENEIKHFGEKSVLTVIKARDLPLSPSNAASYQTRSAILTVNASHHLVTFLSRPITKPGPCVGASLLDLCRANCTWAERLTLPLRLWDSAGRFPHSKDSTIAYLEEAEAARTLADAGGSLAVVSLQRIPPRRPAADACGRW